MTRISERCVARRRPLVEPRHPLSIGRPSMPGSGCRHDVAVLRRLHNPCLKVSVQPAYLCRKAIHLFCNLIGHPYAMIYLARQHRDVARLMGRYDGWTGIGVFAVLEYHARDLAGFVSDQRPQRRDELTQLSINVRNHALRPKMRMESYQDRATQDRVAARVLRRSPSASRDKAGDRPCCRTEAASRKARRGWICWPGRETRFDDCSSGIFV